MTDTRQSIHPTPGHRTRHCLLLVMTGVALGTAACNGAWSSGAAAARRPIAGVAPLPGAASYRQHGHQMGDTLTPVEVTEFSDFECPACATTAHWLDSLRADSALHFHVRYRHFPLQAVHLSAMAAAIASECAADQGRFESFHDSLFAGQERLGIHPWASYAAEAGVADPRAFADCMRGPDARRRVLIDVAAGKQLGVTGTPTLIIGDSVWTGSPPPRELASRLARIERARAVTAGR